NFWCRGGGLWVLRHSSLWDEGARPDRRLAKDWKSRKNKELAGTSVHIHQLKIEGSSLGIGIGTVNGGSLNAGLVTSVKRYQEERISKKNRKVINTPQTENDEFVPVETGIESDADDEKKEFRYNLRSNKRKIMLRTLYQLMKDLARCLAEADIINISSNNPPINKEFFDRLKETAQSQPPPHVKVNGLKKWIQENYDRKISTTISNIRSVTTIEDFDTKQVEFIKRILEIKLMQFQAGHADGKSNRKNKCINPYCLLDFPSSKWHREMVYHDSSASARKADGILFNYDNTSQEFLLFENIQYAKLSGMETET
ncbi:14261_t:CDS:2, partial [Cetraspora pellucida]